METELVSNLSGVHSVGEILLIGKDKKEGVAQFVLVQHALKLLTGLRHTLTIIRIDHKDDSLCILEVYSIKSDMSHVRGHCHLQCLQSGLILSCPV
jgi:hypothetical protein